MFAATRLLAQQDTDGRVTLQTGNVLIDDLGTDRFDLILMSHLAHHFSDEQNRDLARRVTAALKPGGTYVIGEVVRRNRTSVEDGAGPAIGLFRAYLARQRGQQDR